jgi:hypothetical protein
MSIGNLKDQGNKGNNFPYQLKTLQLLGAINDSISALPGVDYETRTTTYQATCTICGPGYSTSDIIVRYDIIDVATSTLAAEMWFNQTLQTTITPAPLPGDLTPISAPSGVTVLNGPAGAAVNIQDGGNSITIDATSLPLPTGAATEVTLRDIKTSVELIDDCVGTDGVAAPTSSFVIAGVTSGGIQQTIEVNASGHVNIADGGGSITVDGVFFQATQPVSAVSLPLPTGAATETTLGTRLADATFTGRINTLGQKAMAASTPVVLASDQSTLNVTQVERTGTSGYTAAITGVVATDVIVAPGAGLFTYITQVLVTNSHATVGTLVTIQTEDGTGLYAGYAAPAGGGFSVSFTVPIKMPVANKKLQAICGTTGANVYVSASGYKAA